MSTSSLKFKIKGIGLGLNISGAEGFILTCPTARTKNLTKRSFTAFKQARKLYWELSRLYLWISHGGVCFLTGINSTKYWSRILRREVNIRRLIFSLKDDLGAPYNHQNLLSKKFSASSSINLSDEFTKTKLNKNKFVQNFTGLPQANWTILNEAWNHKTLVLRHMKNMVIGMVI